MERARYKVSLTEENTDFTFKKLKMRHVGMKCSGNRSDRVAIRPPVRLLVLDKDEAKSSLMPTFVE